MPNENLPLIEKILAAFSGAVIAAMFLPGSLTRRITLVVAGVVAAHYIAPEVSSFFSLKATTSGFITGLFSMGVIEGLFRGWYRLELDKIIESWLKRRSRK